MKYTGTLIAVKDMEKSKQFYHDVLGMEVAADFGANVTLTGGLVLQTLETWQSFIHTSDVTLKSNSGELYFETEDMGAFYQHLESFDILYVHKLHEHPWGQLVTTGIYRFSRTPAFLCFDLMYVGAVLMYGNLLTLGVSVFAIVMLHLQILQEERYLVNTFGAPYQEYCRHVSRYLGRK